MSIEQTEVIDFISAAKDEQYIDLTISDHLAWDDKNEKLLILQDKLNSYLEFIESGQLIEEYPASKGKKIRIDLRCKFEPNDEGKNFLSIVQPVVNDLGHELKWCLFKK
ncbi:DUF6572 domain-containing protein [Desulfosediminicola flagellatus]|uniref:DUF6572 domain-containing protein n=1 Tax=Desulfosediminicola flagellatus TaxID=2569541 RepID=UPI0010ABCFF6|nr:DUF6572 domain-containing protein [Desulfosediminicola flagellatus]